MKRHKKQWIAVICIVIGGMISDSLTSHVNASETTENTETASEDTKYTKTLQKITKCIEDDYNYVTDMESIQMHSQTTKCMKGHLKTSKGIIIRGVLRKVMKSFKMSYNDMISNLNAQYALKDTKCTVKTPEKQQKCIKKHEIYRKTLKCIEIAQNSFKNNIYVFSCNSV